LASSFAFDFGLLYRHFPLMYAAREGDLRVVKFLVGKGAKVNAQSKEGETALKLAEKEGHAEVVKFLKGR